VFEDDVVDAESGAVDAEGEGGVETLGEPLAEQLDVGDVGRGVVLEDGLELDEPVADVGPLLVLLEVPEEGLQLGAQLLGLLRLRLPLHYAFHHHQP
jgi:hypothetical protein